MRPEKILNTTSHQGIANKKHKELPLFTTRTVTVKKTDNKCWQGLGNWNPHLLPMEKVEVN